MTGGRHDESARLIGIALRRGRVVMQKLQSRNHEGGCLAGAGLRLSGDIPALDGDRDALLLDWSAVRKTCFIQSLLNACIEVEAGKCRIC